MRIQFQGSSPYSVQIRQPALHRSAQKASPAVLFGSSPANPTNPVDPPNPIDADTFRLNDDFLKCVFGYMGLQPNASISDPPTHPEWLTYRYKGFPLKKLYSPNPMPEGFSDLSTVDMRVDANRAKKLGHRQMTELYRHNSSSSVPEQLEHLDSRLFYSLVLRHNIFRQVDTSTRPFSGVEVTIRAPKFKRPEDGPKPSLGAGDRFQMEMHAQDAAPNPFVVHQDLARKLVNQDYKIQAPNADGVARPYDEVHILLGTTPFKPQEWTLISVKLVQHWGTGASEDRLRELVRPGDPGMTALLPVVNTLLQQTREVLTDPAKIYKT